MRLSIGNLGAGGVGGPPADSPDTQPSIADLGSGGAAILDPGFDLTLRPMRYPHLYQMYLDGVKNTWNVAEVSFADDLPDLASKVTAAEAHLIRRLVAFFATGDTIVANNVVLNLYRHINAPEARMYLSRQLFEEAVHIQFYLSLLDSYLPDLDQRAEAFAAVERVPSIRDKADFCFRWMGQVGDRPLRTVVDRRRFLLNLVCFAACVEGLFFFAAFAYVYFLRSRGLLHGLATGTNWVFRDESMHMQFAFEVVDIVRRQEPGLWDDEMSAQVDTMLDEAVEVERRFADDLLELGVHGLAVGDMHRYLRYVTDLRRRQLGLSPRHTVDNPFPFMELQNVQESTNFFERRVAAYQHGVDGAVAFDSRF